MDGAAATGLSETEAQRRLRQAGPPQRQRTSRSYVSIAIANTFTVFNLILAGFGLANVWPPVDGASDGVTTGGLAAGIVALPAVCELPTLTPPLVAAGAAPAGSAATPIDINANAYQRARNCTSFVGLRG